MKPSWKQSSIAVALVLTNCAGAKVADAESLLSACDYYASNKSISDILTSSDQAYRLQTDVAFSGQDHELTEFAADDLFRVSKAAPKVLRVAIIEDRESVFERQSLHNDVSFLMDYADRPPAFGYYGSSSSECGIIPTVVPGVDYWVFLDEGRISLFEPVTDDSRLSEWITYFVESRYPEAVEQEKIPE